MGSVKPLATDMPTDIPDLCYKLLESLSTAVVLVDESCRIEYLNQAAETILGASTLKAKGQDLSKVLSSDERDRNAILNAIQDRNPFVQREAVIYPEPEKKLVIDFSLTPIAINDASKFVFEIQEINRLIRISREEAILASHDKTRQVVRGLAHEVKNPLGGIGGAAQLLHAELQDPELKEYTQVITDEVGRLKGLVDRLLGPNQRMEMEPLNIHLVLDRVVALISAESSDNIELVTDYDPSLPDIQGDYDHLIQAMLNIAQNAIQALQESDTEGPTLRVRTRVQRRFTIGSNIHPLVAQISFQDNGPGIPADRIEEIFLPMITGRDQGTGLGLAIAQSIINNHQGLIQCTSEPGNTKFAVIIPIPTAC